MSDQRSSPASGAPGDTATVRTLVSALLNGSEVQQRKARELLVRFVSAPYDGRGPDPIRELLRCQRDLMSSSRDRWNRIMQDTGRALVDPVARRLAIWKGSELHLLLDLARVVARPELVPALKAHLASTDRWASLFALQALSACGGDESLQILVESLSQDSLRWSAIALLAERKAPSTMAAVARHMGDPSPDVRVEVVRAFQAFGDRRLIPYLTQMCAKEQYERVRVQILGALRRLSALHGISMDEDEIRSKSCFQVKLKTRMDYLLREARLADASDVHVVPGSPPAFRVHGELIEISAPSLTREDADSLIREVVPERMAADLERDLEVDFSYVVPSVGRHRINVFHERRGLSAVVRLIPGEVPSFARIGLPPQLRAIVSMQQGLVLVTGRSGSGKSTTQAALVDLLNESRPVHIVTLEDPIEYLHDRKRGLVNQREIGRHSMGFPVALRAALREDPDVIVVGEMRDMVTMRMAVEAAETGHLVIATLHTPTAVGAVQRLIESFPGSEQQQVRMMLADSLRMVIAQTLVRKATGPGRLAVFELLLCNQAIGAMIRENKLSQVQAALQTGRAEGMRTMDQALLERVEAREINPEDAYSRASNKDLLRGFLNG